MKKTKNLEERLRGRMKTVLITGGSRGIGAACVRAFAQEEGVQIVIGYNEHGELARSLAAEINEKAKDGRIRAIALGADVSKKEEVEAMFAAARETFGPINVLVNNAGISSFSLFTDIDEEEWDHMMNINCKGVFFCAQEALKDMIPEKKGSIINISSMWGQVGASCEVHYSTSKAAVIGMTKALAKELGPSQIRVNCVAPGIIETDMLEEVSETVKVELAAETPLGRLGTAQDIAAAVRFLASEESSFFTGQVIGVNGGFVV